MVVQARRRAETRQRLTAAADSLFAERGFTATTVDAIVAAAGTSRRTFFRHFASKDELVFSDLRAHLDALVDEARRSPSPCNRTAAAAAAVTAAKALDAGGEALRRRVQMIRADESLSVRALEIYRSRQAALAEALASRQHKNPDLEDQVTAAVVMAVYAAVIERWCQGGVVETVADHAVHALAAAALPIPLSASQA